ncbi:DUF411 domain-containing protein [Indioceanicola profundi]|uniref:DUF411 domain-containing protein n=1 Tax=Indioceanicola profundi TaxID=2220096 RepID=UPI000E6AD024|nr:DUF411 domain-containing protein [Indioceanicola profundi]
MRILSAIALSLALLSPTAAFAQSGKEAILYKNPQCGCCEGHAKHLRENGFEVKVVPSHDLPLIKQQQNVPPELAGCHTLLVDGYVVEGHVSATTIKKLLEERPEVKGISLPGMPLGSPGMEGPKLAPFEIYAFKADGSTSLYVTE